jgi:hypothetical protein
LRCCFGGRGSRESFPLLVFRGEILARFSFLEHISARDLVNNPELLERFAHGEES